MLCSTRAQQRQKQEEEQQEEQRKQQQEQQLEEQRKQQQEQQLEELRAAKDRERDHEAWMAQQHLLDQSATSGFQDSFISNSFLACQKKLFSLLQAQCFCRCQPAAGVFGRGRAAAAVRGE